MLSLARNGYSEQSVVDVLHGKDGSRLIKFRYDLLDKFENKKGELLSVVSGEVAMSSTSEIMRTAKFTLKDDGTIDWLSDRIQPFVELRMKDGNFIEFPLGVFLLNSPTRSDKFGEVYRDVEAYDGNIILKEDLVDSRYFIPSGTNYKTAIIALLNSAGIQKHNIEDIDKALSVDREFEIGTSKLEIINTILSEINFIPLHVDENGYFTSYTYRPPVLRATDYVYEDSRVSVVYEGVQEKLDLFSIPNKWVAVVSNSEEPPLQAVYVNDDPNNPLSTVSRGRTLVKYMELERIADQETLDSYIQRVAHEDSQVYGQIEIKTAIMPFHSYRDVLKIHYAKLGVSDKYVETGWSFPLEAGGEMSHTLGKVVSI